MEKHKILCISILGVKPGDTIIHNGKMCTVGKDDIKESKLMGRTIFGDSYRLGHDMVKKVIFE